MLFLFSKLLNQFLRFHFQVRTYFYYSIDKIVLLLLNPLHVCPQATRCSVSVLQDSQADGVRSTLMSVRPNLVTTELLAWTCPRVIDVNVKPVR